MSADHRDQVDDPAAQYLRDAAADGCEESRLLMSRRSFLGLSATFSAWAFAPRISSAAQPGEEPRLLVVMLQGGMDGLHIAVPKDDPAYYSARGSLALHANQLLPLRGSPFGLNTAMKNFHALYTAGQATIIHAIAPPLRVGSHFECMYNLQSGLPGQLARTATSGWLNRLVSEVPAGNPVRGNGLSLGGTMLLTAGPAPMMSWRSGSNYGMPRYQPVVDLYKQYAGADLSLADTLASGARINTLANGGGAAPAGLSPLDKIFRGAGILLGSPEGPRVAAIGIAGFDTHTKESTDLAANLGSLDKALDAFRVATGPAAWAKTVVICCSEFGRTVYANGRDGTDHGVGGIAFLLGGAVKGAKVVTKWPGLGPSQLQGGSLEATTDTRAVFKGILQDHLGVPRTLLDGTIFPQSSDVAPTADLIAEPARDALASQSSSLPGSLAPESAGSSALRAYRLANGAT